MRSKSLKTTLSYVQQAIKDCWEAQANLDDDSEEFKSLTSEIKAYQDIHFYLSGEEYSGDDSEGVSVVEDIPVESDDVLEIDDEINEDDNDDGEDTEDEEP